MHEGNGNKKKAIRNKKNLHIAKDVLIAIKNTIYTVLQFLLIIALIMMIGNMLFS